MSSRWIAGLVIVTAILGAGCAAEKSSLTSTDFPDRVGGVRKVGIVVAEAQIINLTASGGTSFNPKASERCGTCAAAATQQLLSGRGYQVVVIPLDDDTRPLLAAYTSVRGSIFMPFPSNQGRIEGLAPLAGIPAACAKIGVDALVFLGARDHVSTKGRTVLMLLGGGGGHGIAYADLAAVDSSGKIIFYDRKFGTGYTLANDEGVREIFDELVAGLPLAPGE